MMTENKATLADEIALLKRRFHLKLANRRGLVITEGDLATINSRSDDAAIQEYCSRLSRYRTAAEVIVGDGIVRDIITLPLRLSSRAFRR